MLNVQTSSENYNKYQCGTGTITTTGKFTSILQQETFFGNPIPSQFGADSLTMPLAASNFVLKDNNCPMDLFVIEGANDELIEPSGVTEIRQRKRGKPPLLCFYRVPKQRLAKSDYRIRFYPDRMACSLPSLLVRKTDPGHFQNSNGR